MRSRLLSNPSQRYAVVTMLLIVASAAAFLAGQSGIGVLVSLLGVVPACLLYVRAERRQKRRDAEEKDLAR